MASYGISRFIWLYLGLLLAFGQVLNAVQNEIVPDQDSLGIRLDYKLYQRKAVLFSSRLEFNEKPNISNRQMMTLAVDAYKEMEAMTAKYNFGGSKRPNTMTALVVGKEIFFTSSVRKGDALELGPEVVDDLAKCGEGTHKNQARCGEVMTFDAYYKTNIGSEKLSQVKGARIVAITKARKAKNPGPDGEYEIQAPCGDDNTNWGCNLLVKDLDQVDNKNVAADPDTPFNWRQLKRDGKVTVTQSPVPADDGSTITNPGTSNPGHTKPPSKKPGAPDAKPDPETSTEVPPSVDGDEEGGIVPPPKHPSMQNKKPKPNTSSNGQKTDDAGEDGIVSPPKHPSMQNKKPKPKPNTSDNGQETGDAGEDGIVPPAKHPGTKPKKPTKPSGHEDGQDGGGDDNSSGTGTKPKPKPKPKPKGHGTGKTRRYFYA